MMNRGEFGSGNAQQAPYMPEIWQFPGQGYGGKFGNVGGGNDGVMNDGGVDRGCGSGKKRRQGEGESQAGKAVSTSNGNSSNDNDVKRLKSSGGIEEKNESKSEAEPSSGKPLDQKAEKPEPLKDYIHVRVRRGQATDSHSLAERARREKISERMRILQELVPGCNKVIGKAMVLDEIINYIQSLQHQIEFLSMKLEAVNSRISPAFEVFPPKDFGQQAFDPNAMAFASQAPREYSRGSSPEWLHMQIGGNFERTT